MSKITANVQKFFDALISSGMVNKKNIEQLPILWASAHQVRTCPALVEKSKDESRIGQACGRACMKDEDTCLCHLPKEKREVFSNKAKQTRLEKTERKLLEKQSKLENPDETDEQVAAPKEKKKSKKVKEPKESKEKVKDPKEKKVKEPKEPKEKKVVEPKEPKEKKSKKVKETEEVNVAEQKVETVAEDAVETLAAIATGMCIGKTKSGDRCLNNAVQGMELCKRHSK